MGLASFFAGLHVCPANKLIVGMGGRLVVYIVACVPSCPCGGLPEPLPAAHGQKAGFRGYREVLQPPLVHQRTNLRDTDADGLAEFSRREQLFLRQNYLLFVRCDESSCAVQVAAVESDEKQVTFKCAFSIHLSATASGLERSMAQRPYDYLTALGARLAITRNELGISQARMAEALGMSLRAYQSYELGKRSIPVEALVELHRQFQVDLSWVLLGMEAARPGHDLAALERFEVALDKFLTTSDIRLKSEKRGAIVARWYRSLLEGKPIDMDDVRTWIELLTE